MKLLIISFYYFPDLCAGSFRTAALVQALQQSAPELDIDLITTIPNRYASFQVGAEQIETNEHVTIRRIPLPSHQSGFVDQAKAFVSFVRATLKLVKKEEYVLVYATSSRLMTAVLGAWVAWRKKTTLYLDIRDIFVETLQQILPNKITFWLKPILSRIEKWTFTKATRINLVSKGFEPYIQKRYPKAELRWFTNGIDSEFNTLSSQSPKEAGKTIEILYAGNIGEGQGLHVILPDLANRLALHGVRFRIIGDGGRIAQLRASLNEAQCQNVELVPPMARTALIEAYQQANVLFIHLNHYDAFKRVLPSKLFEYAATGKPIFAGLSGYSAQFVKQEIPNAVVFEPCNVSAALSVFPALKLEHTPRNAFIQKYGRKRIMNDMVEDMLSLVE